MCDDPIPFSDPLYYYHHHHSMVHLASELCIILTKAKHVHHYHDHHHQNSRPYPSGGKIHLSFAPEPRGPPPALCGGQRPAR